MYVVLIVECWRSGNKTISWAADKITALDDWNLYNDSTLRFPDKRPQFYPMCVVGFYPSGICFTMSDCHISVALAHAQEMSEQLIMHLVLFVHPSVYHICPFPSKAIIK